MGRCWIRLRFASVALAGACALLGSCGGSNHGACGYDAGPSDGAPNAEGGSGMLVIGGMITNCPLADSLGISPNELDVGEGGMAILTATASVPNQGTPTFSWSAPSGVFGQPDASTTTFECTESGMVTVTVTVSYDGCQNQIAGVVACLAPDGG